VGGDTGRTAGGNGGDPGEQDDDTTDGADRAISADDGGGTAGAAGDGLPPAPEGLPQLLARLGRLLERHGADGVLVLTRDDVERAEVAAYAAGWQDAAEEYGRRAAAARREWWPARWSATAARDRPADVIPFPAGGRGVAGATADTAGERGTRPADAPAGRKGNGRPADSPAGRRVPSGGAKASLTPKNRRSKTPTIPRLVPPQRRPPGSGRDTPEGAAD
jgi:hypothetical protein